MSDIIGRIVDALKENADETTKRNGQRFFKEDIKSHGVKAASVRKLSKQYHREIKAHSKEEIFGLCENLWKSGHLEECAIACEWAYCLHQDYEPEDFEIFELWIDRYVGNWASCDMLCNHTIGAFIEMYPDHVSELKRWTGSNNRWKKRAAAVSLIIPARKGLFLGSIFDIADALLLDGDDLVQKGYGWMLKSASEAHPAQVFDFVMARRASMPRTALRYAIEKLSPSMKKDAMAKPALRPGKAESSPL